MSRTIDVLHGVNLDQLGRRDPAHYGTQTLADLEEAVAGYAGDLGLTARFFQTNHEGAFVEHLHGLRGTTDGIVLNAGAWTHYAWAIHDALEITGVPAVEVHLSDVTQRDAWRQVSVVRDVCIGTVSGRGVEGYRDALQLIVDRHAPG